MAHLWIIIPMTNDDFMGVEWVVMMIHLQT